MRNRFRRVLVTLAVLSVTLSVMSFTAAPAEAIAMDCNPGASSWSTLSSFNNGQVYESRTCTEKALSGPNFGKMRGHTATRCRLGTYGPDTNDQCNIIYGDNSIKVIYYEATGDTFDLTSQYYPTGTYNDTAADYYTPWDCPTQYENSDDRYRTQTINLQAQSSSGQIGADHSQSSYIAEAICGSAK